MARDHRLDFSDHENSTKATFKAEQDRSRSPKRLRSNSWRPSNSVEDESVRHNGRRRRGRAKSRPQNEYRDRSPNQFPDAKGQEAHNNSPREKRPRSNGTETKGLSDKIHSLRRLLDKATDMPADIRQERTRELQGYIEDQQRNLAKKEKRAITRRYHFVRFVERQKAERKLKKLEKNFGKVMIEADDSALHVVDTDTRNAIGYSAELTTNDVSGSQALLSTETLARRQQIFHQQLHEAKVDVNYTIYAPLDQKYISLFPLNSNSQEAQSGNRRPQSLGDDNIRLDNNEAGILRDDSGEKPPLWYEVEKAMQSGSLEMLRDGRPRNADLEENRIAVRRGILGVHGRPGGEDEDETSDEDFFER